MEEPEEDTGSQVLERLVIGFLFAVYVYIFVKIMFL